MTDPFKPFADMFKGAPAAQLPDHVQSMVQDGLSKTREATLRSIEVAKGGAEALSKTNPVAASEASALTNKAFEQALDNTEAAFVTAQAMARAKSPMEAAELQVRYVQAQFAKAGMQGKELFELTTKLAQKTVEATGTFAKKTAKA